MITYIHIEIEENLTVELSCNMDMQDDSFDHEFGTEKIPLYPAPVSGIEFNHDKYNNMQNIIIRYYIACNYNKLIEQFCDRYQWILDNQI